MSVALRPLLTQLLSDDPHREPVRDFVALCHRIARAYLLRKRRRGKRFGLLDLDLDDLAMDGVANLFERDARGHFVQLRRYYEQVDWRELDEDELFETTRRLVFSKVNDRLFQAYREADPSLARILRNVKRTVRSEHALRLVRRPDGRAWLELADAVGQATARPVMPPELLEAYLTPHVRAGVTLRTLLGAVREVLEEQRQYRPAVPLTPLARVLRDAMGRVQLPVAEERPESARFRPPEVRQAVESSVTQMESAMRSSYVKPEKMTERTYRLYFRAIRERLLAHFVEGDDHDVTNYRVLAVHLRGLSYESYRSRHRAVFEYLSRRTRTHFLDQLRDELLGVSEATSVGDEGKV